ncbi:MAG TPA: hypothetical protein VK630_11385, partial [Reyranella sp.]|nr:hypothetical protein [Reyranella sp.]
DLSSCRSPKAVQVAQASIVGLAFANGHRILSNQRINLGPQYLRQAVRSYCLEGHGACPGGRGGAERREERRTRSSSAAEVREALAGQCDVQVVGDRFVFQSEVLFLSGSTQLQPTANISPGRRPTPPAIGASSSSPPTADIGVLVFPPHSYGEVAR